MTPLGVKGHNKVIIIGLGVRVGISESYYGANQAIYKTWTPENTVMYLANECCHGSLWLGLLLSITLFLKDILVLDNETAWLQAI